jgi:hypothetical protein
VAFHAGDAALSTALEEGLFGFVDVSVLQMVSEYLINREVGDGTLRTRKQMFMRERTALFGTIR